MNKLSILFLLKLVVFNLLLANYSLAQQDQQDQKQSEKSQADQKQSNVENSPVKNSLPSESQQPSAVKRGSMNKLYFSPECQDDIKEYCPRSKKIELNDLSVLQCIYNEVPDLSVIDKECHHVSLKFNYVLSR